MRTSLLLLSCLFLLSCTPVFYSTVGQNVPLFGKKEEAYLTGGIGVSFNKDELSDVDGANFMGALAIDSSLAIMSSFNSFNESYADTDGDLIGKGTYFELGIGKFNHGKKSKLAGEIFLGLGYGSIRNTYQDQDANLKFIKPFIQPSGGFSSAMLDIALTPRISWVNYISKSGNSSIADDFYSKKKSTITFEPGVTIRLGYKNVKLQYQYTYSTFKYSFISNDPPYEGQMVNPINNHFESLSVAVFISDRWVRKKK
jgi:hypothetical protein